MGNFYSLCLLHVPCYSVQKRNYNVVEKKILGFVLVYKLACTELHGSDSFVKCVSRCQNSTLIVNLTFDNIRLLIQERLTTIQNVFVV